MRFHVSGEEVSWILKGGCGVMLRGPTPHAHDCLYFITTRVMTCFCLQSGQRGPPLHLVAQFPDVTEHLAKLSCRCLQSFVGCPVRWCSTCIKKSGANPQGCFFRWNDVKRKNIKNSVAPHGCGYTYNYTHVIMPCSPAQAVSNVPG